MIVESSKLVSDSYWQKTTMEEMKYVSYTIQPCFHEILISSVAQTVGGGDLRDLGDILLNLDS